MFSINQATGHRDICGLLPEAVFGYIQVWTMVCQVVVTMDCTKAVQKAVLYYQGQYSENGTRRFRKITFLPYDTF